ncbi:MAG: hypothetical protein LBB89_07885 [Treponema sp.]|nr:hypothetical protein [Treponema sp.]
MKLTDPDNLSPVLKKYKNLMISAIKYYGMDIDKDMPKDEFLKELKKASMKKGAFLQTRAIIGECELVDIVQNSDDPFAEKDCFHWILKNPILYEKPITNVLGHLRLWNFNT